jgi:hypothetical protein
MDLALAGLKARSFLFGKIGKQELSLELFRISCSCVFRTRLLVRKERQLPSYPITNKMLIYYNRNICPHITTHPCRRYGGAATGPTHIPELLPSDPRFTHNNNILENCDDVPGSCSICPTDFTTTIKLCRANASGSPVRAARRHCCSLSRAWWLPLPVKLAMANVLHPTFKLPTRFDYARTARTLLRVGGNQEAMEYGRTCH